MKKYKNISEKEHISMVNEDTGHLWDIIKANIIPSEAVQLAAVKQVYISSNMG